MACGTRTGYETHIVDRTPTCAPCRAAQAAHQNRWRMRSDQHGPLIVDATGTRRRLQALVAIGWRWTAIASEAGVHCEPVRQWSTRTRVTLATRDLVHELYGRLSDRPGGCDRAVERAAAAGWPPPIGWDDDTIDDPDAQPYAGERADVDEVALQRAIAGRPVDLTRAERRELISRLTAAGRSAQDIAAVVGVAQRTVVRHRAAA